MESNWKIVFKGEILPGFDQASVKQGFAQLLKLNEERAKKLFSGNAITLKKELLQEKAEQYKQSFEKRGIKVYLEQDSKTVEVNGFTLALEPTETHTSSESGDDHHDGDQARYSSGAGTGNNKAKVDADFGSGNGNEQFNDNYYASGDANTLYSDEDEVCVEAPEIFSLSFEGRYGRCNFANAYLLSFITATVAVLFMLFLPFGILFGVVFLVVAIVYAARLVSLRLHDLNLSGWYYLLFIVILVLLAIGGHSLLVTLINDIGMVVLMAYPGKPYSNNYGPPSEQGHPIGIILLSIFMIIGLLVQV